MANTTVNGLVGGEVSHSITLPKFIEVGEKLTSINVTTTHHLQFVLESGQIVQTEQPIIDMSPVLDLIDQLNSKVEAQAIELSKLSGAVYVSEGKVFFNNIELTDGSIIADSAADPGAESMYITFESSGEEYRVPKGGGATIRTPASGKITAVLTGGQSLSYGGGTSPIEPTVRDNDYPAQILMLNGHKSYGPRDSQLDESLVTGYETVPVYDQYNSPSIAMFTQIIERFQDAQLDPPTLIHACHAMGARDIATLSDKSNQWMYRNGLTQARLIKEYAEGYGLDLDTNVFYVWIHGEADHTNSAYKDAVIDLYNSNKADLESLLGSINLVWLMDQLTTLNSQVTGARQYDAAETPGMHLVMNKSVVCNRLFPADSILDNDDFTHLSKRGYWLQSAYFARAISNVMLGMQVPKNGYASVVLQGDKATVEFEVSDGDLVIDTGINVDNLGFRVSQSGNSSFAIIDAQHIGVNTIELTFNSVPITGSTLSIKHGLSGTSYTNVRGVQLVSKTGETVKEINVPLDYFMPAFDYRIVP